MKIWNKMQSWFSSSKRGKMFWVTYEVAVMVNVGGVYQSMEIEESMHEVTSSTYCFDHIPELFFFVFSARAHDMRVNMRVMR